MRPVNIGISLAMAVCFMTSLSPIQSNQRRPKAPTDDTIQKRLHTLAEQLVEAGAGVNRAAILSAGISDLRKVEEADEKMLFYRWLLFYESIGASEAAPLLMEAAVEVLHHLRIPMRTRAEVLVDGTGQEPAVSPELRKNLSWTSSDSHLPLRYLRVFRSIDDIEPSSNVRRQLSQASSAVQVTGRSRKLNDDGIRQINEMKQAFEGFDDQQELIRQWILLSREAAQASDASDRKRALDTVFRKLDLGRDASLEALYPFLGSEDPETRKAVSEVLWIVDDRQQRGTPNLRLHESLLRIRRESGKAPLLPVLDRLCGWAPEHALASFWRVYGEASAETDSGYYPNFIVAEHMIGEYLWKKEEGLLTADDEDQDIPKVIEQLTFLARYSNPWHARYYCSMTLRHHPELRTAELTKLIREDPEKMVRDNRITAAPKP